MRIIYGMSAVLKNKRTGKSAIPVWLILVFFISCIGVSLYRSTDYVVTDADFAISDSCMAIEANSSVSVDITTEHKNLRSVLFHVGLQENDADTTAILVAELFHDDELIVSREISAQDEELGLESSDRPMELELPENAVQYESYRLVLRVDSTDGTGTWYASRNADTLNIWTRCTYCLLTNSQRVVADILVLWGLLALGVFILGGTLSPEKIFLLLSIVLGGLYLFFLPSQLVPDSANHYVRSYMITKGFLLLPNGGQVTIPTNLLPFRNYSYTWYSLLHNFGNSINWNSTESYDAVNMALYSPINYIFQSCGIGLAEVFSNNTHVLQLTGELANYAGCTLIIYEAIRKMPYGKITIAALSLLPMAMQERMSLSADALAYASVVAITAFVVYERQSNGIMRRKDYAVMYSLIILLASCKIIYFTAGFLVLMIPTEKFGDRIKCTFHKIMSVGTLFVFSLGWLLIAASRYLGNTRGGSTSDVKMDIIFHQPVRYVYIVNKMILENGAEYLFEMIGSKLGPTSITVSDLVILAALIVLITVILCEKSDSCMRDRRVGLFLFGISMMTILLVMTSLYVQWTSPEAATYSIEGIQGRYFLPIMPVFLMALLIRKSSGTDEYSERTRHYSELVSIAGIFFAMYGVNLLSLVYCWNYQSYIG